MNDDCLLAIFRYLNLRESIPTARVSKQTPKNFPLTISIKIQKMNLGEHFRQTDKKWLNHTFINFGHLVEELSIKTKLIEHFEEPMQRQTIGLIQEYCAQEGNHLKTLTLKYFPRVGLALHNLYGIFNNLHKLTLGRTKLPCSAGETLNQLKGAAEKTISFCTYRITIHSRNIICNRLGSS